MIANIVNTFKNCFKIPELKSRILFTAAVLAICRLAAIITIPGLDGAELARFFEAQENRTGGALGLFSTFTGGAMEKCAVGSLGIMPYISATIIVQLLTAVYGPWSKLAREEGGRTRLIQYGRYLTVLLCLGQGLAMAIAWENPQRVFNADDIRPLVLYPENWIWYYRVQTVLILTTGTMLLMWLGEQITDRGIGNGVSLIITIGILARLPAAGRALVDMFSPGGAIQGFNPAHAIALLLLLAGVIAGIIAITQAQRKIPVQYAQRAVGRKVYSGGTSFMPLRVNYAGVMPIIFAQAILMFPQKIFFFLGESWDVPFLRELAAALDYAAPFYLIVYSLMILFFTYFWVATQFNELQIADDLKKNGGYIPGVRPGQATSDFLHNAMSRITLAGAVFLVIIAIIPMILYRMMNMPDDVAQFFGGTSLLIAVGVMLDTMRQMESHLLMRHYDGFLKKGRVRGRF
ncbi:MAG TPA: preprotein translocase subunit SecY [Verrucomicrobia bacterium]|nr:preprotein translocase subunit SecY [Verrucomicrobiota bacterium]HOP98152.1 preprotein translocase subunit SecY [Verrucomicrobiota bacterium]HPU54743.1 preprotein translocase subunit SecY [Verrucomicrobiota bacterium]